MIIVLGHCKNNQLSATNWQTFQFKRIEAWWEDKMDKQNSIIMEMVGQRIWQKGSRFHERKPKFNCWYKR